MVPFMNSAVTREEIEHFLAECGYSSNPEGSAHPPVVEFVSETKEAAYFDVNADAVRKGDEVPDRPIRVTFHVIFDGTFSRWKLRSVEELAPGIKSKALDRQPETPKISPWPDTKKKPARQIIGKKKKCPEALQPRRIAEKHRRT